MLWAPIIAGVAAVASAFIGYLNHRRISEVHVLVNARLDTALQRIGQLANALEAGGLPVPPGPRVKDTQQ